MYKLKQLKEKFGLSDLVSWDVPNQDKIIEATGSPLSLQDAYDLIVKISDNFNLYDEKAIEADHLLAELIEFGLKPKKPPETVPELPAPTKEEYNATLDALMVMADTMSEDEANDMGLLDTIMAIETMLSFM